MVRDADGRDLLDRVVRRAAGAGATVVVASHELERAGALASRQVTVAGGIVYARADDDATDIPGGD